MGLQKKRNKRKAKKNMSEEVKSIEFPAVDIEKGKGSGTLEIRGEQGSTGKLEIYFRHPVLADIVEKMSLGNFQGDQFAKEYKPCLMPHPDPKAAKIGLVATRPAVYVASKNFESGVDLDFAKPPRGILICNPTALRAGFSLVVELKTPVPVDTLRKWGQQLIRGCDDILAASRPFKIAWNMTESVPGTL
jgi:hypothetical protein